MKAIWSGAISFGLVNIPIKLYIAAKSKDVVFRSLHSICQTPLQRPYYCPNCQRQVSHEEIVKGYEFVKGQYAILSDMDFQSIPIETTRRLDIISFVDLKEIDPIFFESSYYLGPEEVSIKAFEMLREAMQKKNKAAIAKVVFRNKEHLVTIRANENCLIMSTLFYADEIRDSSVLAYPKPEISASEIELAEILVDALSMKLELEKYVDRFREALHELIKAKIEGKEIRVGPEVKPTIELMDALKASIEATKKQ